MKHFTFLFTTFFSFAIAAQNNVELIKEIEAYQITANEEFINPETTILDSLTFKDFEKLEFYAIDLKYRIEAQFIRTPDEKPFLMPTTTTRLPEYVKYGEAHFTIEGKNLKLNLYQSVEPYDEPGYENYLFLPFTDLTSGDGSYGGGRFLDAYIPEGETMIIDFNKSYNPYCAYNIPVPSRQRKMIYWYG